MSAYYDLYENADLKQTGKKQPLHARVVSKGTITNKQFVKRVSQCQHLPHAIINGAMDAVVDELKDLLLEGFTVEFGDLGYFSLSLKVNHSVMEKKELRSPSIQLKDINLRINRQFKKHFKVDLKLERYPYSSSSTRTLSEEECLKRLENFFKKSPCINRRDYSALTGKSKQQAIQDINSFLKKGIIKRYGSGRGVVYLKGE